MPPAPAQLGPVADQAPNLNTLCFEQAKDIQLQDFSG
jgi:hypothetical protein